MENFCFEKIYSRLGDDESRFLFEKRLMYSLIGDMERMINEICSSKPFLKQLQDGQKRYFIFGSGTNAFLTIRKFPDIPWQAFIDNNPSRIGKTDVLPIISFSDFMSDCENAIVFTASSIYGLEMKQQLMKHGFPEESILGDGIEYFDLPHFQPQRNELFIDAGGWDGYTTKNFFAWLNRNGGEKGRSIIFEPHPKQFKICQENHLKWGSENIEVINKGLWLKSEMLRFSKQEMGSCISTEGEEIIEVIGLDELLKDEKEPVTFIKMDIEGAELNALYGAEKTIREQKPKLAICIYHKPEDIWEIPTLLLDFVPEYRFYIRHYFFEERDTILYAMVD